MSRPLARLIRLGAWIIAVAIALPVQWIGIELRWQTVLIWLPAEAALLSIVILLASTPVGAIRLRRWLSESLILAGMVALMAAAKVPWNFGGIAMVATAAIQLILRRSDRSTWWSAILAWNPALIAVIEHWK